MTYKKLGQIFFGQVRGPQSPGGTKFWNLKILIFLLLPQNFGTKQGLQLKFLHLIPKIACPLSYTKELRWIGQKMTKLEPVSWRRSTFLKIHVTCRIAIFDVVSKNFIFTIWTQFLGYRSQSFLYCLIIKKTEGRGKFPLPPFPVPNSLARRPCYIGLRNVLKVHKCQKGGII